MAGHQVAHLEARLGPVVAALKEGRWPLSDYLELICDHIEKVDPLVQALIPEANRRTRLLKEAKYLENCFPEISARPPLFGLLVAVKDVIRVQGMATECGSRLPAGLFDGVEAKFVTSLRQAGALILGKTVTAELAMLAPGPTRNPKNLAHTPGGSSSGSAAGVAAGYCPLALGTQTIGSVIRPAAYCGVVGFKPSFGRIGLDGVIPAAPSLDTLGFFSQSAVGLSAILGVVCANWQSDQEVLLAQTAKRPWPTIAVPEGPYLEQVDSPTKEHFIGALEKLAHAGCEIVSIPSFEDLPAITSANSALFHGEIARTHRTWFENYAELYKQLTADTIRQGLVVTNSQMESASNLQKSLRHRLDSVRGIDLWAAPAALGVAPNGIHSTGKSTMSVPWTFAGLPTLTLPSGLGEQGLPLGMQFVAPFLQDELLLFWGKRVESVFNE